MTNNLDLEAAVRDLVDRQSISELIYAYCECFDRNDPEGVAELFTPDAVIDYNPDTANIVGAELADTIAVGLRDLFSATSHHVSNVMITMEGPDTARSLCYIDAWHRYHSGAPDGFLWGRYKNRFIRTDAGWRISHLLLQGAGTSDFHRERMHGIGRA
ncbi:MAG: nuclear transport factor 2 family protein [Congregibacter sp.]